MRISNINNNEVLALQYKYSSGGVDVKSLQQLTDKDQPMEAVKVTVSREARELFRLAQNVKTEQD